MKLNKWDWAWLILDVFIMILCSYFEMVVQDVPLWNKIVYMITVGLAGINFGLTLGEAGKSK